MTHECDACGGTGRNDGKESAQRRARRFGYPGIPEYMKPPKEPLVLCPVCLGAGRISDQMPVSDALADAETLRHWWVRDLESAQDAGERASVEVGAPPDLLRQQVVYAYSAAAARAAFRAVPGLRG